MFATLLCSIVALLQLKVTVVQVLPVIFCRMKIFSTDLSFLQYYNLFFETVVQCLVNGAHGTFCYKHGAIHPCVLQLNVATASSSKASSVTPPAGSAITNASSRSATASILGSGAIANTGKRSIKRMCVPGAIGCFSSCSPAVAARILTRY